MTHFKSIFISFCIVLSIVKGDKTKYTVSILPFYGDNIPRTILGAGSNKLETSLLASKRFIVIEKSRRDALLREQKEQLSDCFSDSCLVKIGKLIGADYLFLGQLINLNGLFQINIKIVGIAKGNIIAKVTKEVTGSSVDLLLGIENASHILIKKLDRRYKIPSKTDLSSIRDKSKKNNLNDPIGSSVPKNYLNYQYRKTIVGISTFYGNPGLLNWGVRFSHFPFSIEYSQGIKGSEDYHIKRLDDILSGDNSSFINSNNITDNYITGREVSIGIGLWQFDRIGLSLNYIWGLSEFIGERDHSEYYESKKNVYKYNGLRIKYYRSFWFAGISFISGDALIIKEEIAFQIGLHYSFGFGRVY